MYCDHKILELNFIAGQYAYLLVGGREKKLEDYNACPYKIIRVVGDFIVKIEKEDGSIVIVHMNIIKYAFLRYEPSKWSSKKKSLIIRD